MSFHVHKKFDSARLIFKVYGQKKTLDNENTLLQISVQIRNSLGGLISLFELIRHRTLYITVCL